MIMLWIQILQSDIFEFAFKKLKDQCIVLLGSIRAIMQNCQWVAFEPPI